MTPEQRLRHMETIPTTFENLSYEDYMFIREESNMLHRHFNYLWNTLGLINVSISKNNYNSFTELFNSFRALTIHNNKVYLVKEGLNNYWKYLDKKNRAISFRRCEGVKKVNNWYGESILTSIIVIEKFSDLPPFIENPLD